jgi:hypothetical protein
MYWRLAMEVSTKAGRNVKLASLSAAMIAALELSSCSWITRARPAVRSLAITRESVRRSLHMHATAIAIFAGTFLATFLSFLPLFLSGERGLRDVQEGNSPAKPELQDGLTSNAVWDHYGSIAGYGRPCVSTPMTASKAHLTFWYSRLLLPEGGRTATGSCCTSSRSRRRSSG